MKAFSLPSALQWKGQGSVSTSRERISLKLWQAFKPKSQDNTYSKQRRSLGKRLWIENVPCLYFGEKQVTSCLCTLALGHPNGGCLYLYK